MPLGIQVFGLVFSAFILYMSFLYYKKKEFTLTEWSFWALFAILFATLSVFPQVLDPIVRSLNLGRKLDLFIILGFMFLIATTFYTYRVARNTDKRVEELVRNMAIEKEKKKKKD
ncbi:hypothetical protein CMO88_01140 [Candidatus Woesearchaeota archaeon]|nr:hypothetical protein [Candidatus Woesearchaeota archaeon]|tara:strand:- start:1011 stop:1355 length:345 start_codon:yes stop_codon:yes gene_type:complete